MAMQFRYTAPTKLSRFLDMVYKKRPGRYPTLSRMVTKLLEDGVVGELMQILTKDFLEELVATQVITKSFTTHSNYPYYVVAPGYEFTEYMERIDCKDGDDLTAYDHDMPRKRIGTPYFKTQRNPTGGALKKIVTDTRTPEAQRMLEEDTARKNMVMK